MCAPTRDSPVTASYYNIQGRTAQGRLDDSEWGKMKKGEPKKGSPGVSMF